MENEHLENNLRALCDRENVSFDLLQELLEIERDYQNKERRVGVFDRIKSEIEQTIYKEQDVNS